MPKRRAGPGPGPEGPAGPGPRIHRIRGEDDIDLDAPCTRCGDSEPGRGNDMVFCDGCNRCFHQRCHRPAVLALPRGGFYCEVCTSPWMPATYDPTAFGILKEAVASSGGWPEEGKDRCPALHRTVLSLEAMLGARWYQEIVVAAAGAGPAGLRAQLALVVPHKIAAIRETLYRNTNLMKNHRSTIVAYGTWCTREPQQGYALDSPEKAANFLRYYVAHVVANRTQRRGAVSEAETAYNAYRNAVSPLEKLADIFGYPELSQRLSTKAPVLALEASLMRAYNEARNAVQDYGATSRMATKTLTPGEKAGMVEALWTGAAVAGYRTAMAAEQAQMRDMLLTCLLDSAGRRGEDLRAIRLPMLMGHELEHVGPATAMGVGASIRIVKERVNADETMLAWVRTADREICPVGSLAMYLVWLNDLDTRIGFLSMIRRDLERQRARGDAAAAPAAPAPWHAEWWHVFLVFSDDPRQPISSTTHIQGAGRIQEAAGIRGKKAKTQIHRSSTAISLVEKGIAIDDVEMYQGWRHTTATDVYVRSAFKTGPLLAAAGWKGPDAFECWWETPRDELAHVPRVLLDAVLPGVDDLAREAREAFDARGLDRSAVLFTELLVYLRRVFLEDAAARRGAHASFPVFRLPEWEAFAAAERDRVARRQALWEARRSNPELADTLRTEMGREIRALDERIRGLGELRGLAAAGEPREPPSAPAGIHGALIFKDDDMAGLYDHWQRHAAVLRGNRSIPWSKAFPDPKAAHAQSVRLSKLRPWLAYIDGLVDAGWEAPDAIGKMQTVAQALGLSPSVFIKDAFYSLAKPPKPGARRAPAADPARLAKMLDVVGLPCPGPC